MDIGVYITDEEFPKFQKYQAERLDQCSLDIVADYVIKRGREELPEEMAMLLTETSDMTEFQSNYIKTRLDTIGSMGISPLRLAFEAFLYGEITGQLKKRQVLNDRHASQV